MDAALFSSKRGDWLTPEWLLNEVREFAGGCIDLDPCGHELASVAATKEYLGICPRDPLSPSMPYRDGLKEDWSGEGFTYVNPPYGRGIGHWVKKCHTADECIALVPARVDTQWFQNYCAPPSAEAVCFIKGRLKFLQPVEREDVGGFECVAEELDPAPFPSALVYWGNRAKEFEERFRMIGAVWLPHTRVHAVVDALPMAQAMPRFRMPVRRRVPQYQAVA